MSWANGILGVWQWGKDGLWQSYDYHLRPECPKCAADTTCAVPPLAAVTDTVYTVRQEVPMMAVSGITRLAGLSGAAAIGVYIYI